MSKRALKRSDEEEIEGTDFYISIPKIKPEHAKFIRENVYSFNYLTSLFSCDICGIDISKSVKVCCSICKSPEQKGHPLTMCLECFRTTPKKGESLHQLWHPYHIMNKLDFPLFQSSWNAQEDLSLIRGISRSGIDNWSKVAHIIGTKTPLECESHFYTFYYKNPSNPNPEISDVVAKPRPKPDY